jgi:hypothetical protein
VTAAPAAFVAVTIGVTVPSCWPLVDRT